MPHRELPPEKLQEVRDFAAQWGKIVARRAFGDTGPGLDVSLRTMEDIAHAAAAGLVEGTLATLLGQQTDVLGPEHPCPTCGRLCTLHREQRPLVGPDTRLTYSEPLGHCPACRRDFFPPTDHPGAG